MKYKIQFEWLRLRHILLLTNVFQSNTHNISIGIVIGVRWYVSWKEIVKLFLEGIQPPVARLLTDNQITCFDPSEA